MPLPSVEDVFVLCQMASAAAQAEGVAAMTPIKSEILQFWAEVDTSAGADGCWEHRLKARTACVVIGNRRQRPRRWAYEFGTVKPLTPTLLIVTECGNQRCCNPKHLRAVTKAELQHRRNKPNRNNVRSGVRNVYKDRSRWVAQFELDGHKIRVGRFDSIAEADVAVRAAREQLRRAP